MNGATSDCLDDLGFCCNCFLFWCRKLSMMVVTWTEHIFLCIQLIKVISDRFVCGVRLVLAFSHLLVSVVLLYDCFCCYALTLFLMVYHMCLNLILSKFMQSEWYWISTELL